MPGFPWHDHRSLAEVVETETLRGRYATLTADEWLRLKVLTAKELRATGRRGD